MTYARNLSNPREVLEGVRELLSNRYHWIKVHDAVDTHGRKVSPRSPYACKFCLQGAVDAMCPYPEPNREVMQALSRVVFPYGGSPSEALFKPEERVQRFNDHPDTTHEKILKTVDRALLEFFK